MFLPCSYQCGQRKTLSGESDGNYSSGAFLERTPAPGYGSYENMDRIEWFVEKATEIGFDELSFLNCRYSERKVIKTERIEKIVVSAVKQSLKARKPIVNEMEDFGRFMQRDFSGQKFIAHCYEGEKPLLKDVLKPGEDAVVLIGPEGDFSREEVEKAESLGFQPISLGKSRLRTETAALVAVHTMNLFNS